MYSCFFMPISIIMYTISTVTSTSPTSPFTMDAKVKTTTKQQFILKINCACVCFGVYAKAGMILGGGLLLVTWAEFSCFIGWNMRYG